jgi:hypothetical protein
MTILRSCWLKSLAVVVLTCLPLIAQEPVNSPAPPHTIPEGTTFLIRLNDRLDTGRLEQGKHFKAKLAEDLVAPDGTSIPRGKKVKGHVSSVEQGLHARMLLSFDEIETDHGWMPLIATVTGVPGEHAANQPDAEGEIERKGTSKRRMVETAAVGAGLGAAGGAAAGGGKGAAIGAGVGATAGALAGILTDRNLRLDKGTVLEVRLDHPLQVPWR